MYKKCGCCGKEFFMPWDVNLRDYLYKQRIGTTWDSLEYYCGYTCWRKKEIKSPRRYKRP
jgi:hypothetical protein